jgi:hypothetical protein
VVASNAGSYYGFPAALLTWTPPDNGGSDIIYYRILYSGGITSGYGNSALITGLAPGAYYTFGISAVNSIGQGGQAESNGIITPL